MGYQGVKPSTPLAELREVCVAGPYNTRYAGAVGVAGDGLQRSAVFRLLSVLLEYHIYCFSVLPSCFTHHNAALHGNTFGV